VKVLVLGGTRFIGRHLVTACLDRGDEVTVLHRGQSPSPFDDLVQYIHTDRRTPTATAARMLAQSWEVVLDTSANDLDDLRLVLAMLGPVERYVMLSTCGVYRRIPGQHAPLTERSPTILAEPVDPVWASASGKLRCERLLRRRLDRAGVPWLIARLGFVIGTYDYTQRLAYWLQRVMRSGDALIPIDPTQPLCLIDALDVARFLRHAVDARLGHVVNVAGPPITARDLINCLFGQTDTKATPCWIAEDFALTHGLQPWIEVPLWLPPFNPQRALMSVNSGRAVAAGLIYRPLNETLADCLAWQQLQNTWSPHGLDSHREQELLHLWREATR
jgi:nucleoside-diphosphate-sugar epimerase